MLTRQQLIDLEPGIFAKGETTDDIKGVNVSGSGKVIKWVAVRGTIDDWALYVESPWNPAIDYDFVRRLGDKIASEVLVRKLVPCDDGAWGRYRR